MFNSSERANTTEAKKRLIAAGVIAAFAAAALTGCSQAGAEHKPTASHSAKATEAPKPEYQKTPTAAQLEKLYMPANATDAQLAQNAVDVSNLILTGSQQGLTTLREKNKMVGDGEATDGTDADDKMAYEWTAPIFSDPNIFNQQSTYNQQAHAKNADNILTNMSVRNYESYGGEQASMTLDYTPGDYHSNGAGEDHNLTVDITFDEPTQAYNGAGSDIVNGQKGSIKVDYVTSLDGTHEIIEDLTLYNTRVQ